MGDATSAFPGTSITSSNHSYESLSTFAWLYIQIYTSQYYFSLYSSSDVEK